MTVQDLLVNMESVVFGDAFLQAIKEFYHASLQRLDDDTIEQDYLSAKAHFDTVLNREQKAKIQEIEMLNSASLSYSAKYGFKCGLYCGFRQYFAVDTDVDAGFNNILCQDLLMQPGMQRHSENYTCLKTAQQLIQEIEEMLSPDDLHMVSFCCAWNNRIYNAALQGFYCGYRAAYSIIEHIEPLGKIQNIGKILSTEYYLGFTYLYADTERFEQLRT